MNHQAQFPSPFNNGGSRSTPPISPYSQTIESQSFNPGSSHSRSISLPSLSPSLSALPPLPFRWTNTSRGYSGGTLPPRKAHRRENSDIGSLLKSLMPRCDKRWTYPKPIEMPVGVKRVNDVERNNCDSEDGNMTVSEKATSGFKRIFRSVSMDDNLIGKWRIGEELRPSPGGFQGVTSSDDRDEKFYDLEIEKGFFTASEMNNIVSSETLKELAASDPEQVKRILANKQSAALSKEKKARIMMHEHELQEKLETRQAEAETLSAQIRLTQRGTFVVESKNMEMRIRYKETKRRVKRSDAFINELTGEVNRLKMEIGELRSESDRLNIELMEASKFQQLHSKQIHQKPTE